MYKKRLDEHITDQLLTCDYDFFLFPFCFLLGWLDELSTDTASFFPLDELSNLCRVGRAPLSTDSVNKTVWCIPVHETSITTDIQLFHSLCLLLKLFLLLTLSVLVSTNDTAALFIFIVTWKPLITTIDLSIVQNSRKWGRPHSTGNIHVEMNSHSTCNKVKIITGACGNCLVCASTCVWSLTS